MEGQVSRKIQKIGAVRLASYLAFQVLTFLEVSVVTGSEDGPFVESCTKRKNPVLRPIPAWRANFCKAESVGGELYYCADASVISDIPTKAHWPFKAHLWVNAGRLDNINQGRTVLGFIVLQPRPYGSFQFAAWMSRRVLENDRFGFSLSSINFSIIYRFNPVRVEVNFGVPFVASKSDGSRKGVQVLGMGLEFIKTFKGIPVALIVMRNTIVVYIYLFFFSFFCNSCH